MSDMKSPLARLVLFLVALSLSGGIVAGIASSVPALSPQDTAPAAPANTAYMDCVYGCILRYNGQNMDEVQACGQVCLTRSLNEG